MRFDIPHAIRAATQLTLDRKLMEATRVIQNALSGNTTDPASNLPTRQPASHRNGEVLPLQLSLPLGGSTEADVKLENDAEKERGAPRSNARFRRATHGQRCHWEL